MVDDDTETTDRSQAVIEREDVQLVMRAAAKHGPMVAAMMSWIYEFGARASEVGMQRLKDVDLRAKRARPIHLKKGQAQRWHPLLLFCQQTLPPWFVERKRRIETPEQELYLFPDKGVCYTCAGTGERFVMGRKGQERFKKEKVPCHHCGATGKRWGVSRVEVHRIAVEVMTEAGLPAGRRHPHTLRHSIVTHLLDGKVSPGVIKDRVGHRDLATTLSYVNLTKGAQDQLLAGMADIYAGWDFGGEK